jgi:hypothetical protein
MSQHLHSQALAKSTSRSKIDENIMMLRRSHISAGAGHWAAFWEEHISEDRHGLLAQLYGITIYQRFVSFDPRL